MAEQNMGGLPIDMNQLPTIGASDNDLQLLKQAQQEYIDALKQRYAQPNLFNVAAALAKPQLGGFVASLGSANEALGKNLEQRRSMELPIAQAKAQMAQTQYLLNRRQRANDAITQYQSEHPGEALPASLISNLGAYDPANPAYASYLKGQEVSQNQINNSIKVLDAQLQSGQITRDQYNSQLAAFGKMSPIKVGENISSSAGQPTSGTNKPQATEDKTSIAEQDYLIKQRPMSGIPAGEQAKNGALGPSDFLPSTITDLQQRYKLPDWNGKDDKVVSQYENSYLSDSKNALSKNNLDPTAANHRALWWFGTGDGTKLLSSDPTTNLSDVLSPEVIKQNGLKGNMTIGELKSNINGSLWKNGINPDAIVGAQPTSEKQDFLTLEQSGLTGPQAQEMAGKSALEREGVFANKFNHIVTSYDPNVTNARASNLKRAYDLMHGKDGANVQEAMGQLWKDKGFINAVEGVVNDGLNLSISPGLSANFGFNLNDALTRATVDPTIRAKLLEINRIIMQDAQSDFREGAKNLGGGHINQSEFQSLRNQIPSTDNPSPLLSQWIMKRRAENKLNANLYGATQQYLKDTNNDSKYSHSNFFKSTYSPYQNALDSYKSDYKNALNSIGE